MAMTPPKSPNSGTKIKKEESNDNDILVENVRRDYTEDDIQKTLDLINGAVPEVINEDTSDIYLVGEEIEYEDVSHNDENDEKTPVETKSSTNPQDKVDAGEDDFKKLEDAQKQQIEENRIKSQAQSEREATEKIAEEIRKKEDALKQPKPEDKRSTLASQLQQKTNYEQKINQQDVHAENVFGKKEETGQEEKKQEQKEEPQSGQTQNNQNQNQSQSQSQSQSSDPEMDDQDSELVAELIVEAFEESVVMLGTAYSIVGKREQFLMPIEKKLKMISVAKRIITKYKWKMSLEASLVMTAVSYFAVCFFRSNEMRRDEKRKRREEQEAKQEKKRRESEVVEVYAEIVQ